MLVFLFVSFFSLLPPVFKSACFYDAKVAQTQGLFGEGLGKNGKEGCVCQWLCGFSFFFFFVSFLVFSTPSLFLRGVMYFLCTLVFVFFLPLLFSYNLLLGIFFIIKKKKSEVTRTGEKGGEWE